MYPTILVMLAFDERDQDVLDAAASIAPAVGLQRVLLAHVHRQDPFPDWMSSAEVHSPAPPAALDEATAALRARLPGIDVVGIHAVGSPPEQLQRIVAQEDVDLLVIGRNAAVDNDSGWGPSGRELLRAVTCSALVVPRDAEVDLATAVVGLDFSHGSTSALRAAAQIAARTDAVYQYDLRAVAVGTQTEAAFAERIEAAARAHFEEDVLPALGDVRRPTFSIIQAEKASSTLIDRAADKLLVVGSRGMTRLATLLLGSTAEVTAGRARGPVLIVRTKGEQLGLLAGLVHR
ncbi:MAG: universal stress protein [Myxococcota bacterium]|nr:universal stress protein [Myxococcota bacterium]